MPGSTLPYRLVHRVHGHAGAVIFIIRTRKNPFRSRPNPWLTACSLTVVAVASLCRSPPRVPFSFCAPPPFYFFILAGLLLLYLLAVEGMKQWFFHHIAAE